MRKITKQQIDNMLALIPTRKQDRSYANAIMIDNGRAIITNGFAILFYYNSDFDEYQQMVCDKDFEIVDYKFPKIEEYINRETGLSVNGDDLYKMLTCIKPKELKKMRLRLEPNHMLSLTGDNYHLLNDDSAYYDPAIAAKYLKAIPPEKIKTLRGWAYNDKKFLSLMFGKEFELILARNVKK
jgi:hypothetical protein